MSQLTAEHRRAIRKISSGAMGTIISSLLATILPWLAASAAFNLVAVLRSVFRLRELKKKMKEIGLAVKKRDIWRGILEGLAIKFSSTVVFLGHDDLVTFCHGWADYLQRFVPRGSWLDRNWIPDKVKVWEKKRSENKLIKSTSEAGGWAVERYQHDMGFDTSSTAWGPGHGWHASRNQVLAQTFETGGIQYYGDKVVDKCFDDRAPGLFRRLFGRRSRKSR